jgi:hypothetical protein
VVLIPKGTPTSRGWQQTALSTSCGISSSCNSAIPAERGGV